MATAPSPTPSPNPTPAKFRIDVAIHDLLMNNPQGPSAAASLGLELPEPTFPLHPERLADPGPEMPPDKRNWTVPELYRQVRGWLFPYINPAFCLAISIRSRPTCSSNTNATLIAGIAGPSTTR